MASTPARWRREVKILKGQDLIIRTSRGKNLFFGGAFWQILHREFHSESHFWVKGFQGFWDSLDWIQGEMYPKNTFLCSVFFQGKSCDRFFIQELTHPPAVPGKRV